MNDVDPADWRRLLSEAERAVMLSEIQSVSLAAGTNRLFHQPRSDMHISTVSVSGSPSLIERLSLIEHLLPILSQALRRITQSPLTAAATSVSHTLPLQARQVTAAAWMDYARRSPARRTIDETVSVTMYSTPENRAIKAFVQLLERDCCAISEAATSDEETQAALRADRCARQLHQMLPEPRWQEIHSRSSDWKQPPTHREMQRPDYARIFRARSDYKKLFCFDWNNPLLSLPSRETWRLYEIWCFFKTLQSLLDLGWKTILPQEDFAVQPGRLAATLATGAQSRIALRSCRGEFLSLTYNQTFTQGNESLSHTMQPDIILSDGERLWILDAKFKPYAGPGEEGEDINQMHAYRDAIIGPAGIHTVSHAWCLYAGQAETPNRAHVTYGRQSDTAVGALCLRPGNAETFTNLTALLDQWLPAATVQ